MQMKMYADLNQNEQSSINIMTLSPSKHELIKRTASNMSMSMLPGGNIRSQFAQCNKLESAFKNTSLNLMNRKLTHVSEEEDDNFETNSQHGVKWKNKLREKQIGPLKYDERAEKIYNFLKKKHRNKKGFAYKRRSKVAGKRLRIKGRFVTREQAFEILGITQDQLADNELLQNLLEKKEVQMNTLMDGKNGNKNIKISNLQALMNKDYSTAVS